MIKIEAFVVVFYLILAALYLLYLAVIFFQYVKTPTIEVTGILIHKSSIKSLFEKFYKRKTRFYGIVLKTDGTKQDLYMKRKTFKKIQIGDRGKFKMKANKLIRFERTDGVKI